MIALLASAEALAGASACSTVSWPLPRGPAQVWLWDGQLGLAQPVCPKTTLGVAPRGLILADSAAFYGRVAASTTLDARLALDERTSVGMTMEPIRLESAISALSSSWVGYGSTSLTASTRLDRGEGAAVAVVGRAVLPTAIGLYGQTWPVGGDVGLGFDAGGGLWSAHGQIGVAALGALGVGATGLSVGVPMTLGGGWQPKSGFGLLLDLQSSVGFHAPLDHLALVPAARVGTGRLGMELGVAVPVAGADRTDAVARLGATWALW